MIKGINNKNKPKGLNKIKLVIETKMVNGSIKNNWNKIKMIMAKPNITKNKSAFILQMITNSIIKNNRESKNCIVNYVIQN